MKIRLLGLEVNARNLLPKRNRWEIYRPPYVVVLEIIRMAEKSTILFINWLLRLLFSGPLSVLMAMV